MPTARERSSDGARSDHWRFTIAAVIALAAAAIPYVWVLWDGRLDPMRQVYGRTLFANFYDVQARALFDGHWWLPSGRIGIEAFVIDGREYTYFGPLPALLRMPVLAITDQYDGRLTAVSMLVAWFVTGLFAALLLWRVRVVARGAAPLSRSEATALAVLLAVIMSGSTLLYLAAVPAVYQEALAWGTATAVGALFALLGVLERPTAARVVATGALTLGAVLSRNTVGWGCVVGLLVAAVWFAAGRGGERNRGWWLPLATMGVGALAVGAAITWVKFGGPFTHPLDTQVWSDVNEHRREFLDANGGRAFSFAFLPSTLWAYLRPDGLRLDTVYPFITLPDTPPREVGGVVMDQLYRTSSLPASMPLLFLLGIWGAFSAFRSRSTLRLTRIPLFAAAVGTVGVLVWGGIANRFLADFLPFLVLASAAGLVDLWRRLEQRSGAWIGGVLAAIIGLAVFGVAAHLGMSTQAANLAAPSDDVHGYVETKQAVAEDLGDSLDVERVSELPTWAPADQLFAVGDCTGLYISTGEQFVPRWLAVEQGNDVLHTLDLTYSEVDQGRIPLVAAGGEGETTVSVEDRAFGLSRWMRFRIDGPGESEVSRWAALRPGEEYRVVVSADPWIHRATVSLDGEELLEGRMGGSDPGAAQTRRAGEDGPQVTVVNRRDPEPTLCRSLIDSSDS